MTVKLCYMGVICGTLLAAPHRGELMVSPETLTLRLDQEVIAEIPRDRSIEDDLTEQNLLPIGSCELAFTNQLRNSMTRSEYVTFFRQFDGFEPERLYRGSALAERDVAQILGLKPQYVLESYAYSKARRSLPPHQQESTLGALVARETVFASLLGDFSAPARWNPSNPGVSEIVALAALQQEAIGKTLVGTERDSKDALAFSVSAAFYDS